MHYTSYTERSVWPVEAQSDLRLIRVEVIAAYTGNSLHMSVVLLQDIFVVLCGWWNVVHFLWQHHNTETK